VGNEWYFVGVDLGQSQDFTAIAVLERTELKGDWDPAAFAHRKLVKLRLRYLERPSLGTPYTEVVQRVVQVTRSADLAKRCHLIVDGTGVGRPVVDLLRATGPGCTLMPVTITGGGQEHWSKGFHQVPKRDLIVGLQLLFQRAELQIAAGLALGATLERELADMRVKISSPGREQFGAWREGQHDDLVLAVALACWGARKMYPHAPAGENAYCRWTHGAPDLRKPVGLTRTNNKTFWQRMDRNEHE
jgi:hypothetical protein